MPELPTAEDVVAARTRLAGLVRQTPVLRSDELNALTGLNLFFKCENLQITGSFKMRGATNAVRLLVSSVADLAKRGVATHSSGNHGAALAAAAAEVGVPARIVVPEGAPAVKVEAIQAAGAEIHRCGPSLRDRERMLASVVDATGAEFVPPYNDGRIIAGQGSAALELLEEVGTLDALWVPVGGGGLASGSVLGVGGRTRVEGAEPELADDAFRSLACGELQPALPPVTIADGLRTALGPLTFAILRRYGLRITLVSEAEIIRAQRLLWRWLRVVVEPSGAVAFAGVLKRAADNRSDAQAAGGERVGVIISGGNVEFPEG